MSAFVLACISFALLVGLIASWMRMINKVQVERGRLRLRLLAGASMVAAGLALVQGPELFGGILAGVSLVVTSVFVILSSLAGQSGQIPAVAVGQPLLEFSAPDQNGNVFDSATLRGKPILLKFFRGHW